MARAFTGNRGAFLDTIAFSEIGPALLKASDDGYNVLVSSTWLKPLLFSPYDDHPRRLIHLGAHLQSTAAGRYQTLERNYDFYRAKLGLEDFSPESQDLIAWQQISECRGAVAAIDGGDLTPAVSAVRHLWASFPGAGYGQREVAMTALECAFRAAGGLMLPPMRGA